MPFCVCCSILMQLPHCNKYSVNSLIVHTSPVRSLCLLTMSLGIVDVSFINLADWLPPPPFVLTDHTPGRTTIVMPNFCKEFFTQYSFVEGLKQSQNMCPSFPTNVCGTAANSFILGKTQTICLLSWRRLTRMKF